MKRVFSTIAVVVLTTLVGVAQTTSYGGEIIGAANMKHTDAALLSQTDNSFMSARVSAMGGAFASLGADLSSMSINPAGLGMYRSSALSISAGFNKARTTNAYNAAGSTDTDFAFNQVGLALNLYQGSGSLASFTFGFAYNKLADLNYVQNYSWSGDNVTIGEFFAEQMWGVPESWIGTNNDPFRNNDINVDEWGGVLAYQTYLIDPVVDADNNTSYIVPSIPLDMSINPHMVARSRGSVGEYTFSGGMNFANILYVGATIGIQDISHSLDYKYAETYTPESNDAAVLRYMSYTPQVSTYGSGINFKIGAILRPIPAVRFGVAYHTSTSVEIIRDYQTSMYTLFGNGDAYGAESLINSFGLNYSSPNKLLLGASVQLGEKALLSVDYDMVWYDNISFHTGYTNINEAMNRSVDLDLGKANNLRVGLEMRPLSRLYLRGGYALYGSPFNDEVTELVKEDKPFYGNYKTTTENYSLGLGWRFAGGSMLDVAWINSTANYTNHYLYQYYTDNVAEGSDPILVQSPEIKNNKLRRNTFTATYTLLF